MKVTNADRQVETNIPNTARSAMIVANAKAFQVLSSNLYTDKPLAIVRELCTNALDAHIFAGNEATPFQIVLPSALRPELHVKDFGTGLDDDAILELYMTYFGSDKHHSNLLTGGLGLGSKTPFSYTDTFTVISRFNGRKRTYTAFKDQDQMPKIVMLQEVETDEHNGLEVVVPVKQLDYRTFREAAQKALQYFPPKSFHITGVEITHPDYEVRTATYGVRRYNHQDEAASRVVMGPIAYPIDYDTLGAQNTERLAMVQRIRRFDIFAEVGEFDIQASREALSYDKRTVDGILARMLQIQNEMLKDTIKAVEDEPTRWARCQRARRAASELRARNLAALTSFVDDATIENLGSNNAVAVVGEFQRQQPEVIWKGKFNPLDFDSSISEPVFIFLDDRWSGTHPTAKFVKEERLLLKRYEYKFAFVRGEKMKREIQKICGTKNWVDFSDIATPTKRAVGVKAGATRKQAGDLLVKNSCFHAKHRRLMWDPKRVQVSELKPETHAWVPLANYEIAARALGLGDQKLDTVKKAETLGLLNNLTLIGIPRAEGQLDEVIGKKIPILERYLFKTLQNAWNGAEFRAAMHASYNYETLLTEFERRYMDTNFDNFEEMGKRYPDSLFNKMLLAYDAIRKGRDVKYHAYLDLFSAYPDHFKTPKVFTRDEVPFFGLFRSSMGKYRMFGDHYLACQRDWDKSRSGGPYRYNSYYGSQMRFGIGMPEIDHYFHLMEN